LVSEQGTPEKQKPAKKSPVASRTSLFPPPSHVPDEILLVLLAHLLTSSSCLPPCERTRVDTAGQPLVAEDGGIAEGHQAREQAILAARFPRGSP